LIVSSVLVESLAFATAIRAVGGGILSSSSSRRGDGKRLRLAGGVVKGSMQRKDLLILGVRLTLAGWRRVESGSTSVKIGRTGTGGKKAGRLVVLLGVLGLLLGFLDSRALVCSSYGRSRMLTWTGSAWASWPDEDGHRTSPS
jgi:hypothetical protein